MPDILMGVGKAGLKESGKPDILVVVLPYPCVSSFLFTDNYFKAGSVIYSERVAKRTEKVSALVINSGNANCGTGEEGIMHAELMARQVAQKLDIKHDEVLVFSTGIIGKPLPIDRVLKAIDDACSILEPLDLERASEAISTTDSFPKFDFVKKEQLETFGFAKGAGMIAPSMATMLAFVFTKADVDYETLRQIHRDVNERTFNSITVDGCESTNDSFGLIALGEVQANPEDVKAQVFEVTENLAKKIVEDGEGATKVIKVTVKRATLEMKAREIARAVANSLLVKTAMYGRDPNWGRIAAAAGSTEFPIDPFSMKIYIGGHLLYDGKPHPKAGSMAKRYLEEEKEIEVVIDLNEGRNSWTYYSSDIGYEYVRINAEYHT
ncbi:glutamate N-acetyltransferase [Hydrogenivirga caldilitoris]|uniref:Arginine biosynthesis bifunctional protein ArgJ n=1 Tax=Hydrogenivirga caldilitoris TaxID=246264 RepID=A0A497XQA7_9AQUI|nr:bifunctional glutamate N-acetyltransferase/amino-acid acetyltransferase ArgJ [Hydrogenivirga caldilitoris]RLJ71155.1 glutamate N-acetyltransferase [Hydrogenivirga caldilitoris]